MEKYRVLKQIGEGGFGSVYLAERKKDGERVAIKCILLKNVEWFGQLTKIPTEVAILTQLKNVEGVSKILDSFEYSNYYCVVMEYYNGQDLFDYIGDKGTLSIEETKIITKRLVQVLIELEKKNIYHNDIKSENIMISEGWNLILIDFGAATTDGDKPNRKFSGTRVCAPPEWIVEKVYNPKHATSWSIGILLVGMLAGNVPFYSDADIIGCQYSLPDIVPETTQMLVKKCLATNPYERPCLQEIFQMI